MVFLDVVLMLFQKFFAQNLEGGFLFLVRQGRLGRQRGVALRPFSLCRPERQRRAPPRSFASLRKTKRGHPEAERPKGLFFRA